MTLAGACAHTLVRAILIALVALALALPLRRVLADAPAPWRIALWGMLLAVFLAPSLLVGYAYADFATLDLIRRPASREAFYALLMALKLVPVAALVLRFAPRPLSPQAAYCYALLGAKPGGMPRVIPWKHGILWLRAVLLRAGLWLRIGGRVELATLALLTVLAFSDHELVTLMQVPSWTVWLFDAHALGLGLASSVRHALLPAACSAALLAACLALVWRHARLSAAETPLRRAASPTAWCISAASAGLYLAAALALLIVWPLRLVGRETLQGLGPLMDRFVIGRDMTVSLWLAGAAALATVALSAWLTAPLRAGRAAPRRAAAALLLCLPGFLGPLVLAFALLWAMQRLPTDAVRWLSLTSWPLIAGLTLLLLPAAVLIALPLDARFPRHGLHLARLLHAAPGRAGAAMRRRGRFLAWQLRLRGRLWLAFFLFYWAYLEVTVAALLSAPGQIPIAVTLYNQMHYGRSHVLSAMVAVAVAAPLALLAIVLAMRAALARWVRHG